ncbi:MAG: hypothetical protein CMM50_04110 [Rhodospirillaceae bacterium]|nr:hypothetical protein [Rhodospirillaceae bacterium]
MARSVFFAFARTDGPARCEPAPAAWRQHAGAEFALTMPAIDGGPGQRTLRLRGRLVAAVGDCEVAAVLIGPTAARSAALRLAILAILAAGTPLFGIRTHGLGDTGGRTAASGPSPFDYVAMARHRQPPEIRYLEWRRAGWQPARLDEPITPPPPPYRRVETWAKLSSLVPTYDWVAHNGTANLASWVELAYWRGRG